MPAISTPKVLVTGASGYIGAWIVKYLVERNYSVLIAMRVQSQIDFIVNRFPEYKGKVTGIVVPDICAPGAYDQAVKTVDAIVHVASPVPTHEIDDPSLIIEPAVGGTTGILASAHKYGTHIKRVVLTSSNIATSAIRIKDDGAEPFDETFWNTESIATVEKDPRSAGAWHAYGASKSLGEKAAWDFVREQKPTFDLVSILPVYNWGPYIHEAPKHKGVGSSPDVFLSTLAAPDTTGAPFADWVDVRDAALLHVLALELPEAGGERIMATTSTCALQNLYDVLNDAGYPNIPGKESYGAGKAVLKDQSFSNTKSLRLFPDFKYRSFEESVRDMGESLVEGGFL